MAGDEGGPPGVSIPESLRETIQAIKKVAAKHSDEDIYGMLKECNMDPDETTQKLLYIDTFQLVVSKRKSKPSPVIMQQRGARGDNQNNPSDRSNGGRKSSKSSKPAPRKSPAVARVSQKLPSQSTKPNGIKADKDMKSRETSSSLPVSGLSSASDPVLVPSRNIKNSVRDKKLSQVNTALKEVSEDTCSKNATQKVDIKPQSTTRRQSVIFPDHFHVPEDVKSALTFGSFNQPSDPETSPIPQSLSPEQVDQPSNALLNPTSSEEYILPGGRSQDSLLYYGSSVPHFDLQLQELKTQGPLSTAANLSNPIPQRYHYPPNYFPYNHYYPHLYMPQSNDIYMPPPTAASATGPKFPTYTGNVKTDVGIHWELKGHNPQGQAVASPPTRVSNKSFPLLGSYSLPGLLSLPRKQMDGTGKF